MFDKSFEGLNGAELLVTCLEHAGVTHVFGIPGAKVDPVFEALADSSIEVVVCRHEQNAGFMAGVMGRLTGRPGVCIGTSGPGTSNFCTAMITATTEGDPVVCLSGAVPQRMRHQKTHQSMDNVGLMQPVTKFAHEVSSADAVPELIAEAFRAALSPRQGAAYLSLPYDVMLAQASGGPLHMAPPSQGAADSAAIERAVSMIEQATCPVLLAGMSATAPAAAEAFAGLLRDRPMPVVGTWEAAGLVPRDLLGCFFGRVGLFHNQPGDQLLSQADLIVTVGFDPVEYDPSIWNAGRQGAIVHIDAIESDSDVHYQPQEELVGDLASTIEAIRLGLGEIPSVDERPGIEPIRSAVEAQRSLPACHKAMPIHPALLVGHVQAAVDDDTIVICDVGSHYIWMGRHFLCHRPRHLLFSNGQQTLGVALPWAIGACLSRPEAQVLSMSGDGGFLFSAQALETAVRLGCNLTHLVWRDGRYDMVAFQQRMKYGRDCGVDFGEPDIVAFAESFGAKGLRLETPDQLPELIRTGMSMPGPVLIDVPVDYSDNIDLAKTMRESPRSH
ncbi:MAG: acetolactate synthase AlsS [Phycisphaerales bacterium]|nr:acetolactate synthase AlsS [Phycisphaerales bacterium]